MTGTRSHISNKQIANIKDHYFHLAYNIHVSRGMRKPDFANAKTKAQISCAVTVQLISTFVFATRIVQSLFCLNPKFQSSIFDCNRPARKPRRLVFPRRGSCISYSKIRYVWLTVMRYKCYKLCDLEGAINDISRKKQLGHNDKICHNTDFFNESRQFTSINNALIY